MNTERHVLEDEEIITEVEVASGIIRLRKDGIMTYDPPEDLTYKTLDHLKEEFETYRKITDGVPHLFLSNHGKIRKVDNEAKVFSKRTLPLIATRIAVVTNDPLARFFANTFMYLFKPEVPAKLFKERNRALEWLKPKKDAGNPVR